MDQSITKRIAVFPGSFDPITKGHIDIVKRALPLFDEIIIAVGSNSVKSSLFSLEVRLNWLEKVFKDDDKISVGQYEGLTVHYCKEVNANYLVRGLRNASDFDYEKTISQLNNIVGDNIDTVFFISKPEFSHISSTIVREIIKGKGNIESFIPEEIIIDYDG
ncbi:MAG: pantetheine-phosphate adenylyltransferase, partial [Saprospiraceae bacterium]